MTDVKTNLERLLGFMRGFRATQTAYVMAKLGVADALAEGPATAAEVAHKVSANPEALGRFLRMAAHYGLVEEVAGERFALTEFGRPLRSDVEDSIRANAVMYGETHWDAWSALLYSVQTGERAFDHVFGAPFFDYMASHPDAQATFDAAMGAGSDVYFAALADAHDFSVARKLVDVGGGNGSLSAIILKRHPHLEAVIYDQPQVLEAADRYLTRAGVRDRCSLVTGNFFESVPEGGDVYLLSNIVHDWADQGALRILKNCRAAMNAAGAVLLVEMVVPEHGTATVAAVNDVNMLVLLPGRERTRSQFDVLLGQAGLGIRNITPFSKEESLIEARPL